MPIDLASHIPNTCIVVCNFSYLVWRFSSALELRTDPTHALIEAALSLRIHAAHIYTYIHSLTHTHLSTYTPLFTERIPNTHALNVEAPEKPKLN